MKRSKSWQANQGKRIFLFGQISILFACLHSLALPGVIEDFADKHCMECHDVDTEKGGFNIEPIFDPPTPDRRADFLSHIIGMVERGEMPPEEKPEFFKSDETKAFIAATGGELLAYFEKKAETRLGHLQRLRSDHYVNTIQSLLGYPLRNIESILPTDDRASLHPAEVTDYHLVRYVKAAEQALGYAINRTSKGEQTIRLDIPALVKRNEKRGARARVPHHPEKGWMLARSRVGGFSTSSEIKTWKPIPLAGLYRVRARVMAHRQPTNFRVAVRSSNPTSNQVSGLMGSTPIHKGRAEVDRFSDIEVDAYFDAGDYPVVQKTSETWAPFRINEFEVDNEKHNGMWVQMLEATGPLPDEIEAKRGAILGNHPPGREGAARVLADFLPRAFRSPVADDDVEPFLEVYDRDLAKSNDHHHALREALKTALASTRFLYRNGGSGPLNSYEIATRLSYFLWSTMPDETLFALAKEGKLSQPEIRAAQVDRMLADAKSERFVRDFTDFWLQLHRVGETKPGFRTKPRYNALLEEDIRTETRLFFREVLHGDLDVASFLDSDWTMLNENMATLYQMTDRDITGIEFRRVTLKPEDQRGGLLAQSSFACLTSNGTETQPILRGVWVLQNLLNQPLEPPKNVEPIETDARGAKTMLEQIRLHRDAEACQGCHQKIDPLGIALENYGVIGNWRTQYRSKLPIVTTVEEYSDLSGIAGVKAFLAEREEEFEVQLINKLKEYALGREITYYDLHRSRHSAAAGKIGLKSLIKAIVADESFLVR